MIHEPDYRAIVNPLDLDFYKLTMMQWAFYHAPKAEVKYRLMRYSGKVYDELSEHCDSVKSLIVRNTQDLRFIGEDADYLRKLGFREEFLSWLVNFFFFDPERSVKVWKGEKGMEIEVSGRWVDCILYETYILSILSELHLLKTVRPNSAFEWLEVKKKIFQSAYDEAQIFAGNVYDKKITDFGTRRRAVIDVQDALFGELYGDGILVGTSNVLLSQNYDLKPIGTMAHEYLQAWQVLAIEQGGCLRDFQRAALFGWAAEYPYDLRIALTDVVGMDAFLEDFEYDLACIYKGCRHDSGDPFVWGEKLIRHYESLGIDPKEKLAVFSDGLTFQKIAEIHKVFDGRINLSFGIGTKLTNDTTYLKDAYEGICPPPSIVMKMTEFNGRPVAKISDTPEKATCIDPKFLEELKITFA